METSKDNPEAKTDRSHETLKAAVGGALFMGTLIGTINSSHGTVPALTAGTKQMIYTAFSGMVLTPVYEYFASRAKSAHQHFYPIVFPASATILMTYAVHSFRGTPEPEWSTLPAMVISPTVLTIWHVRRQIQEFHDFLETIEIEFEPSDFDFHI